MSIDVEPGDLWQVGKAVFYCGDIENPQHMVHLAAMVDRSRWNIVYTDPPWGGSINTRFRRMVDQKPVTFAGTLAALARVVHACAEHAFIEMGVKWKAELDAAMISRGWREVRSIPITYHVHLPATLTLYERPDTLKVIQASQVAALAQLDDKDTPLAVANMLPRDNITIIDPCVGKGTTARAAYARGHRFIGMELNPKRLAIAIEKQARLDGTRAVKITHESSFSYLQVGDKT